MATFNKRTWVNGQQPAINDTNLNALENDIQTFGNNISQEANNAILSKAGYDQYSNESTYAIGDYCIYNNILYVCNIAIVTGEEFDSAKWTAITIAELIENMQTSLDDLTLTRTGSGTANTTYIDTVENNHWERYGKIVTYAFTMRVKGTWNSTTVFISGLPKPKATTRFAGVNSSNSNNPVFRAQINTDGTIQNAYSQGVPSTNQVIEGRIVYITTDN